MFTSRFLVAALALVVASACSVRGQGMLNFTGSDNAAPGSFGANLGNTFNSLGRRAGLGNLMGGMGRIGNNGANGGDVAPASAGAARSGDGNGNGSAGARGLGGDAAGGKGAAKSEGGKSGESGGEVSRHGDEGFLGIKDPAEIIKLLLNPFEFCAKIAEHFKLHFEKFFPMVSKGVNFGLELAIQPMILSLKIIEKVFVPDTCKLRYVCRLTKHMSFSKEYIPTVSEKVLGESKMFRAMNDGIRGNDCEAVYVCEGEPKIKDEFIKGQKEHKGHHHHHHKDHHNHKDHFQELQDLQFPYEEGQRS